ncbi:tetratricopeptide repeat-containing sulfotransferase family protein [Pseudoxanthomonas sp.]|uniref:tetratricopeptide repeat-containing sulfotransferase family protein n=1 Tax=Pseudoxanthomonas sp. TaxID=1871049 RepID=UPI002582A4EB|nr:tetratricopeptide repeat-containing sulfotransferase family protein [Pseudoxanthomonas sp.]MCR6684933.1 sulfotransferase [Pseudoxanthomonas sp.]
MNSQHVDPPTADARRGLELIAQGKTLLRDGRFAEAVELGRSLARTHPQLAPAFAFLAEACRLAGDLPAAVEAIDTAIGLGDDPQHRIKKAWLLSRSYRRDEVPALAAELSAQAGNNALVLWQIGKLYYHHNLLLEAISHYERALDLVGDHPGWRYDLAVARFYAGQSGQAEDDLNRILSVSPQAGPVIYLRSTLRRQKPESNHVADIRARLQAGFARDEDQACALYALGKELEDLGEHEDSFAALAVGAQKRRGTLNYDASAFYAILDEIREVMDAQAMSAPARGHEEEGAIFIVGMPRTGTTLAERMLLQSDRVANAGELTDFGYLMTTEVGKVRAATPSLSPAKASAVLDFAALGKAYMRGARQMAGGSACFIDKMPANYMYCGVIHRALPKAKIIHLVRDSLDTCYAVFKTLFFNAYEFSYDLDELADYYIAYRKMMRHWHEVMPDVILDVRYEDLVTDPEGQSRRIYEWCGLEWTPAALDVPDQKKVFATASAAQVREPVHARSVGSSRKHLHRLAPLVEKLQRSGFYEA